MLINENISYIEKINALKRNAEIYIYKEGLLFDIKYD